MRGIVMLLAIWALACTSRQVEPTRQSRKTIDTLFQAQVLVLQPKMDSLCQVTFDSLFQASVDSILKERKQEMKKLME